MTSHHRPIGAFITLAALMTPPALIILMGAGWPDHVQGTRASDAMPILLENGAALNLGGFLFVIANLLWFPAIWLLARTLFDRQNAWVELAIWLAAASLALRALWFAVGQTVNPILTELWPGLSPQAQEAMDVVYILLNDTLSTVQEDIGVNILGGVAGLILSVQMLRHRTMPIWIAALGIAGHAALILSSAELVGLSAGDAVALAAPTLSGFWMMFAGIVLMLRGAAAPARLLAAE